VSKARRCWAGKAGCNRLDNLLLLRQRLTTFSLPLGSGSVRRGFRVPSLLRDRAWATATNRSPGLPRCRFLSPRISMALRSCYRRFEAPVRRGDGAGLSRNGSTSFPAPGRFAFRRCAVSDAAPRQTSFLFRFARASA